MTLDKILLVTFGRGIPLSAQSSSIMCLMVCDSTQKHKETIPMADTLANESSAAAPPPPPPEAEPPQTVEAEPTQTKPKYGIEELASIAGDVQRTVLQSTDSALRSARSFQENSSTHFRSFQEFLPELKSQYQAYEEAAFKKVKDEMTSAREHPAVAAGLAVTAAFLLLRGPRRFLFRQTLGRFQSEEAQFVKAEKNVKELSLSVDLMKKESKKLLERAALAEKNMKRGQSELTSAGHQIHRLSKSVNKVEAQATSLMDFLREVPGREALKLRAEVASVASLLKEQRAAMNKKIMKISEYGVSV